MFEHRIEHQNYFDFPASIEKLKDKPIEKLVIRHCQHARFNLQHPLFSRLKFLIIENCAFVDMQIRLDHCDLQEFTLKNSKYIRLLSFQGDFPNWSQLNFENCKHSFLIGPWSGNIGIEHINFVNCKGIHVFEKDTHVPKLTSITFSYSYHMTLTFKPLHTTKLEEITFDHCKFFVERSIGVGWTQLQRFSLNYCDKFYFPPSDWEFFHKAVQFEFIPIPSHPARDTENIESNLEELQREIEQSEETDKKDIEIDGKGDSSEFPKMILPKKFCTHCGSEAIGIARFCAQCGKRFRA